ncbi:hypothetical protein [Breoghania sp.]|nr:hypothetical protein [Breoghania sp.]MDJ0931752.1 hypothetical protein [Breoghania sp.]
MRESKAHHYCDARRPVIEQRLEDEDDGQEIEDRADLHDGG